MMTIYSMPCCQSWRREKFNMWSSSAIAERDRAAGLVNYGQKWKTGTGRQYFTDIKGPTGISLTTVM